MANSGGEASSYWCANLATSLAAPCSFPNARALSVTHEVHYTLASASLLSAVGALAAATQSISTKAVGLRCECDRREGGREGGSQLVWKRPSRQKGVRLAFQNDATHRLFDTDLGDER